MGEPHGTPNRSMIFSRPRRGRIFDPFRVGTRFCLFPFHGFHSWLPTFLCFGEAQTWHSERSFECVQLAAAFASSQLAGWPEILSFHPPRAGWKSIGNDESRMRRECSKFAVRRDSRKLGAGMCAGTMHEDRGDDSDFRKQACEKESGSKLHALKASLRVPEQFVLNGVRGE